MRHTRKVLAVLRVFVDHPGQRLNAADISKLAGLQAGTIYPALLELELAGWVCSGWGERVGRYRRRMYWLNPARPHAEALP